MCISSQCLASLKGLPSYPKITKAQKKTFSSVEELEPGSCLESAGSHHSVSQQACHLALGGWKISTLQPYWGIRRQWDNRCSNSVWSRKVLLTCLKHIVHLQWIKWKYINFYFYTEKCARCRMLSSVEGRKVGRREGGRVEMREDVVVWM